MASRLPVWLALASLLASPTGAHAQDPDPAAWSRSAARGAFDLCRGDAPDASAVAEHGQIWGWPRFTPYLEHPEGYERDSGGESRRELTAGDKTSYVEMTVQGGQVVSAAPADIRYFRCNVTANQPIDADLEAYFTALYGPPTAKSDKATVWLAGAAAGAAPDNEAAALKPLAAAAPGAQALRVELSHELGVDNAKLSIYRKSE
jgi:hypothetical protein